MKLLTLSLFAATAAVAPVTAQSRWDVLTMDQPWAGIEQCKVYCEVTSHIVSSTALYVLGDEVLRLVPGIDEQESRLLATGLALGFAIGAEIDPFLDTFYDDAPAPGSRRVNSTAEALEKTVWAWSELGAITVGDFLGSRLLGQIVGVGANLSLQWALLPHRGLTPE